MIKVKRVYYEPDEGDGIRILVDRLWPRGLSMERAKVDLWLKDIAPGNELRKWFAHELEKWKEFRRRYFEELEDKQKDIDEMFNNAAALRDYIRARNKLLIYPIVIFTNHWRLMPGVDYVMDIIVCIVLSVYYCSCFGTYRPCSGRVPFRETIG